MGRICCHGGPRIIALFVVMLTLSLIVTGPIVESVLLQTGKVNSCSVVDSVEQRSITGMCLSIYAVQGAYMILVFCLSVISLLMCNGSLMCDLMFDCKNEDPKPDDIPILRFRDDV